MITLSNFRAAPLLVALLVLAGCGGGSDDGNNASPTQSSVGKKIFFDTSLSSDGKTLYAIAGGDLQRWDARTLEHQPYAPQPNDSAAAKSAGSNPFGSSQDGHQNIVLGLGSSALAFRIISMALVQAGR